jgi:Mce-associated membrane protein
MKVVDGTKRSRARGRALAITTVISFVAAVVLAGSGGVLWFVRAAHDHQVRDTAVTVAARNQVLALLTLNPDSVQSSLDAVLAGATGGWRQQFAGEADRFTQVVHTGQVRAQATISSSAIQKADDQRATVLVSANAMIQNAESPQGYLGAYRVLLDLEIQGGRWLVSNLEFVA